MSQSMSQLKGVIIMAVNRKQFTQIVDKGIKATKDYNKFYLNFKANGKVVQRTIDYTTKDWGKRTRITAIKKELQILKDKSIDQSTNFRDTSTLNAIAEFYFANACDTKLKWQQDRVRLYKAHFSNTLGKKRIKDIRTSHIDVIRKKLETKGLTKQTENGCNPRTIKLLLVSILKPILQYAVDNKVIDSLPIIIVPKQSRKKKIVKDAKNKLTLLYKTIMTIYADNGFYRALFLFSLFGRRFNEIATLQWNDIDILNNTYTIRAINCKIGEEQIYELPAPIAEALSDIKTDGNLVFESPVTKRKISTPKRQLDKLKKATGIEELTMHYFRHILVSAMGEIGVAGTILSASLGHTNLSTVNDFYLSANHRKSSQTANKAIEGLVNKE